MIELAMLPGRDGDCLLLSYGTGDGRRRVLLDGGRGATYAEVAPVLAALDPPWLDLLVVTHVDQDHVLGVLALFADPARVPVREVWFNGFDHLKGVALETFGARDGELLTTALLDQNVPWNRAFGGEPVEFDRPVVSLGDATYRIVAPDRDLLERLAPVWERECREHGLMPGVAARPIPPEGFETFGAGNVDTLAATPFRSDTSKANATSISFLFECNGVRILFTGDGDDARIVESLTPLAKAEGGRLRLDALKIAHHGSAGNISRRLLDLIDCPRYLISTNGDRHAHPDPIAMARILVHGGPNKELVFNYRERAKPWDRRELRAKYGLTVVTPPADQDGTVTMTWQE